MIYLYTRYKSGCASTIKAKKWLKMYDIEYEVLFPKDITEKHIKEMLRLSDSMDDIILSRSVGRKIWEELKLNQESLERMSLKSFMRLLAKHPVLLKTLIIFDDKKIVTGYNEDEIRAFLPEKYRQVIRRRIAM